MVSDLDEINRRLKQLVEQGTNVVSGLSVIKAVDDKALVLILKSEGILSAEEVLINNPDNLKANMVTKLNKEHLGLKNVIYASVAPAVRTREEQRSNINYGRVNIVLKDSVLNRPNTTYTYYDTGSYVQYSPGQPIEFYKSELLTESELVQAESENKFIELQIKGKIGLDEIKEIVFLDRPPTTEESNLANKNNIPLIYKGAVVGSNIPNNYNVITNSGGDVLPILPTPTVSNPINTPPQLPDFGDIPRLPSIPKNPTPINPNDPRPIAGVPMFTDFPSHEAVADYLRSGRDIEVLYDIKYLAPYFRNAARDGNAGVWSKGVRYTHPFPDL